MSSPGRLLRAVPAVLCAGAIFFVSHQPKLPDLGLHFEGSDKLMHALAYAVLAACLLFGLAWPPWPRALWAAGLAALYGVTDELHQHFVPGRSTDVLDWLADAGGATLLVAVVSRRALRRTEVVR